MQAESLEALEKADIAPAQARAIVRAIEIEIDGAKDTLATKHDLMLLRQDLRGEISELRSELRREISDLRTELQSDIAKLEGKLEGKMHELASGITRQMYTAVLGQMAVLLGFAYFFATHVR